MEKFKRRHYFIDRRFQSRFIVKFCAIVLFSSLAIGALLFFLLKGSTTVAIENARVTVKSTSDFILPIVTEILFIVAALSAFSVAVLTLFVSHKIVGPLYRLKKETEKIRDGDLKANFTTRKDDQLKELSAVLTQMNEILAGKHADLKKKAADLKISLQGRDMEAALKKLNELEESLNYFKI